MFLNDAVYLVLVILHMIVAIGMRVCVILQHDSGCEMTLGNLLDGGGCRSCVTKGYIFDDFVHLFVRRSIKRAPIINRGKSPHLTYL
jgi:hypothetical protein